MTVINDPDHALAAGFDLNSNGLRASVQRIFQQFLHDGSGPFHNFASSNLVGNSFRQYANTTHASRPLLREPEMRLMFAELLFCLCSSGGRGFSPDACTEERGASAPEVPWKNLAGIGSNLNSLRAEVC